MVLEHQPVFYLFRIYLGERTLTYERDGFSHLSSICGLLFAGRYPRFCDTDSTILVRARAHDLAICLEHTFVDLRGS